MNLPKSAWIALTLVFAVPALLPFSRSAEAPILIGALMGLRAVWRDRGGIFASAASKTLIYALGAYSLAALLSALDAVAAQKGLGNSLSSLRYLAFGLGLLALVRDSIVGGIAPQQMSRLLAWAAALPVAFWVVDALVQAATGWSLGGTLDADRLSGIFGADDLKLGPLLPAMAPLLLWPLLSAHRLVLAGVWLALLIVVLLAGARAGWISFALVSALLAWRLAHGSWTALIGWFSAATLAAALFAVVGYHSSDSFRARVERTLAASDGQVDVALAGRMPIWRTAFTMAAAHPINGVGVRGFRYAYPDYAATDDPWVDRLQHTGAAHAHQLVLELVTETGVIGLLLWLWAALQLWRRARAARGNEISLAPWLALAVLAFPLNTHLAFYSVFIGIVLAWLIALACAQAWLLEDRPLGSSP